MIRMESICLGCSCTSIHISDISTAPANSCLETAKPSGTLFCVHFKGQHNALPCQQWHMSLQAQNLPSALIKARGALTLYKVR